ncbi:hypothetical protein MPSEU_000504000 [Mayamaea pseudoterrestris]|nr:hypothetical protein MPSEU_000504000 [Mayamaea pseudoterrestris]
MPMSSSLEMPDGWFDFSNDQHQQSRHSSTDVSVSSALPTASKATDKPKRSLSAYNFFFQAQRQNILNAIPSRDDDKPRRSHGKIGFADLARLIASRWKNIDQQEKAVYQQLAADDKARYYREMEVWKKEQIELGNEAAKMDSPRHQAVKSRAVPELIQSKAHTAERRYSRPIPELNLMSNTSQQLLGNDFFTTIDKPLPLDIKSSNDPCPPIADLADKLDADSLEMLVNIFR